MPFSPHIIPAVSNYCRRSVERVFHDVRPIILTVQYYARVTCSESDSRMRRESLTLERRVSICPYRSSRTAEYSKSSVKVDDVVPGASDNWNVSSLDGCPLEVGDFCSAFCSSES